jgi:transposase
MEEKRERKVYDRQFKIDAVSLVTKGGRKVREVAQELGIDVNTLYHWKKEFLKEGEEAFPGKGNLTAQEEEIRRLRRELKQAEEDREILKKALGYFSRRGK